jgi:hypothetical protein
LGFDIPLVLGQASYKLYGVGDLLRAKSGKQSKIRNGSFKALNMGRRMEMLPLGLSNDSPDLWSLRQLIGRACESQEMNLLQAVAQ